MYVLAQNRDASITYYSDRASGTIGWVPVFVRDGFLDDDSLVSFFNKLVRHRLGDSSRDTMKWDVKLKGDFTVKSYYL